MGGRAGRFLFAMWEGGGTAPPELAVASRLIARGHAVTVLGDPTLAEDAKRAGAEFFPWTNAPHRTTRTAESEIVRDWAALTPWGAFARARDRHAFKPAHLFAREVRDRFAKQRVDVIAVDALLFGALVGAEATDARVAAMLPMTSFLRAPRRPPPSIGLQRARSIFGRLRDRALFAVGDALLWRSCLPHLNFARRSVGLADVAHPLDQFDLVDRVLVQTSAWFDFDASPSRGNVRYVGPELGDPSWATSSSSPDVREPREPLVLVSFSTTFMDQRRVLQKIIDALAELPVRALVTTGPAIDPRALRAPRNVTVCASASHAEILPRASLVITHGGHGTVIRALAHGVPLLIMPMGRDQSDNAARAVAIGAAVSISRRANRRALGRAIAHCVGDTGLRENAQRARDAIANENTGDLAVSELEGLLEVSR